MTTERTITAQEERIPQLACHAFREARQTALNNGYSVLEVQKNQLVEVLPDGSVIVRQQIDAPIPVVRGQKISRRVNI
jgi:hypothetical protein